MRGLTKARRDKFKETIRLLAVTAQEALYHDIDESQPEYASGVETLERKFSVILRGKLKL